MDLAYEAANRGPALQAFFIVLTVLTVLSISLRFWSRGLILPQTKHQQRFGLDDWFALAAVPWILAMIGVCFSAVHDGYGRHLSVLPSSKILRVAKDEFVIYFLYDASLFFTKASALLFLRRIFPPQASPKWFNISLWVGHALNLLWLIGICFGTLFMCQPIAKYWNTSLPGHCGSTSSLFIGGVVHSAIDLFILLLPLPRLWYLHMGWGQKVGITIVFLLGYCVIVVSLGRLITVFKSQNVINTDLTYGGVTVVYWLTAEPTISLMGVCFPAMLPLGRHLVATYFSPMARLLTDVLKSRKSRDSHTRSSRQFAAATVEYGDESLLISAPIEGSAIHQAEKGYGLHSPRFVGSQDSLGRASPCLDQYQVDVHVGDPGALGSPTTVPRHAIRVDDDVRVTDT